MYKHLLVGSVLLASLACDSGEKKSISDQIGPATKSINDLKKTELTPEELEARRKAAGFKSKAEIDAELAAKNAAEMEKGEREHVKTRLKEYRALVDGTTKLIDDLGKETAKWAAAKDPQKAFDKASKGLQDRLKEIGKTLDKLSEKGIKGGNTQDLLNKTLRPLEEVMGALAATSGSDAAFTDALTKVREARDNVVKALDEIEKDQSLTVNKFHEGEGEGEGEGDKGGKGDKKGKKDK